MSKKLTKTIILIVFVVFLGINKVNAETCYYRSTENDDDEITVEISDDGSTVTATTNFATTVFGSHEISNPVANWTDTSSDWDGYRDGVGIGDDHEDFYGKTYYDSKSKCPPGLYYVKFWYNTAIYFYTDNDNINAAIKIATAYDRNRWDKFRDTGRDPINFKRVSQPKNNSQSSNAQSNNTSSSNSQSNSAVPETMECDCYDKDNGADIHVVDTFEVHSKSTSPKVTAKSEQIWSSAVDYQNTQQIANWNTVSDILSGTEQASKFTFTSYFEAKHACPTRLIIGYRWDDTKFFFSGSYADFDEGTIEDEIKAALEGKSYTVYSVSCYEASESDDESDNDDSDEEETSSNPEENAEITDVVGSLVDNNSTYSCGSGMIEGVPYKILSLTRIAYNFIQVLVPIVIIVLGILDLLKAITSQKEDEIRKGQSIFFKRLIAAVFVFFVFALIKLVISVVSSQTKKENIIDCMNCFLRGESCVKEKSSSD